MKKSTKKKNENNEIKLIRKANELVEARYKFDIWETRMFAKTLTLIQPYDDDFHEYKISVGDVIEEFGLSKGGEIYEALKQAASSLQDKKITVPRERDGVQTEFTTTLFIGVEKIVDQSVKRDIEKHIWVSFHPKLKPYLLELKQRYLVYDIRSILSLKSVHSIRIYELLKQYEKIGERSFNVDELKSILGIAPEEYSLYGHFKNKVISKAQSDLENNEDTDIRFTFEEIKEGRKVIKIRFLIVRHTPHTQDMAKLNVEINQVSAIENELTLLVEGKVPEATVKGWLAKYPQVAIINAINYTLNRLAAGEQILNIPAYITKMINTPAVSENIEQAQPLTVKAKATAQTTAKTKEKELRLQLDNIRATHFTEKIKLIATIFVHDITIKKRIMAELKLAADYDTKLSEIDNLGRPSIQAIVSIKMTQYYPDLFMEMDANLLKQEQALKIFFGQQ